jgi:hypothetical protein
VSRIASFPEHAVWCGMPVHELPREVLMEAFAYKVLELRECFKVMTREQMEKVSEEMRDVAVPIAYREDELPN